MTHRVSRILIGKYAKDFYFSASGNIGVSIVGALGGILAARLLGPEGRGELAAAVVWIGILITIGQIDLPKSIIYHIAKNYENRNAIIQSVLALLVIQSIAIVGVGLLLALIVLGKFRPNALRSVQTYIWVVPASLLTTYMNALFQGVKRFDLFGLLRFLSASILLFSVLIGYLLGLHGAQSIIVLMVILQYLLAIIAFIWSAIHILKLDRAWKFREIKSLLRYGLKAYVSSLSWITNARIDQFAMSFTVPLGQLGIYAVAVSYAGVLYPILGSFANVLFPHIAGTDYTSAKKKIWRVLAIALLTGAIGATVLAIFIPKLIPLLFGPEFHQAVYPAFVLLAGTIVLGGNYVLGDGLRGLGKPLIPSIAEAVGLFVTLIGLSVLLSRFGIMGAAWTSLISYSTVFLVLAGSIIAISFTFNKQGDK